MTATKRRTMKFLRPDGVIVERSAADAGQMLDSGFVAAPPDSLSVRERVEQLDPGERRRLLAPHGAHQVPVLGTVEHEVSGLTALVEAGTVVLP